MSAEAWSGLAGRLGGRFRLDEPLARHTSFRIGGPAEAWAEPGDEEELEACLREAAGLGKPVTLLAGGTNVLVRDGGVRGLVLSLEGTFKEARVEGTKVRAGAAIPLAVLARRTALKGLQGMEWAVGIPGTLGGGLVMNAGAHGGELKDVVRRVGLWLEGRREVWEAERCGFAYRTSAFRGLPGAVLLWAELEMAGAPVDGLKARMDGYLAGRRASQPMEPANAGCVFKNPPGDSAGRLVEACGLKGRRLGEAEISSKHANFVVNTGGARARDVLGLMEQARQAVRERFGVELEDEILVLGED